METSHDERNMAAIAQGLGIIVALPIWLMWRNRSAFVRAHAVQSIAFDGVTIGSLLLVGALAIGVALGGNAMLSAQPDNGDVARLILLALCAPALALVGFLVVMAAALVLRIRATMAANQGRLFQYPLLKRPSRS